MILATFRLDGRTSVGLVDPERRRIAPLAPVDGVPIGSMQQLIAVYDEVRHTLRTEGEGVALGEATLMAPIPRPRRNVFCVGKNYREHAREFTGSGFDSSAASVADAIPDVPIVFTKVPESVIADGEPILMPAGVSEALDYEAELAVVIGRGGRGISRAQAMDHVFGYTIINDVTARDWQGRHKQ